MQSVVTGQAPIPLPVPSFCYISYISYGNCPLYSSSINSCWLHARATSEYVHNTRSSASCTSTARVQRKCEVRSTTVCSSAFRDELTFFTSTRYRLFGRALACVWYLYTTLLGPLDAARCFSLFRIYGIPSPCRGFEQAQRYKEPWPSPGFPMVNPHGTHRHFACVVLSGAKRGKQSSRFCCLASHERTIRLIYCNALVVVLVKVTDSS